MKEIIWLVCTRQGFERATKRPPVLNRGEIPVKLVLEVDPAVFGPPVLEMKLHVRDWREGLVLPDPELRDMTITEAEAEKIRAQRLAAVEQMLRERGYTVVAPVPDEPQGEDDGEPAGSGSQGSR